jgi:hypothetical protein
VLSLFIVFVLAQMGPWAAAAFADPPDPDECRLANTGERRYQDVGGGLQLVYECQTDNEFGFIWQPLGIRNKPSSVAERYFSDSSPPYQSKVFSIVSPGLGGGIGSAVVDYRHPNDDPLIRRVAARSILSNWNGSSWVTCHDSNWREAPTARSGWEVHVSNQSVPDTPCGYGTYRNRAGGRFFSTSLNTWISNVWTTATIFVPPPPG